MYTQKVRTLLVPAVPNYVTACRTSPCVFLLVGRFLLNFHVFIRLSPSHT